MTRHRRLVQQVRAAGRYSGDEEAERVLTAVLGRLGAQLDGDERRALAEVLPPSLRPVFADRIPLPAPVGAPAFVEALAATLSTSPAAARWDASSVLTTLADLAGPDLADRLLARLPRGYALLFGRADLAAAA
ncbi:DUF2267 domain-containing protein [Kitasatospora sp. NPDC057198]|uniref:DUF2267 domain-containing protein n=1 Tax=Kitasatospora sp. NPDC057198 TaxID=3346046 RepID=UPI0036272447